MTATLVKPERSLDIGDDLPVIIPGLSKRDFWLPKADQYMDAITKYPRIAGAQTARPAAPMIPFIASAHEHTEPFPVISREYSAGLGAETTEFNVPSYGFIRAVWLDVFMPEQEEETQEENEDGVFTALGAITLLDTNGAPIFGPLTGFNTFLTNLYGGYAYQQDPRNQANYKVIEKATKGQFRFQLRIPIEISHHDGTGCIGNQNASAPYRVRFTMEPSEGANAGLYKKQPGKYKAGASLKIRPYLEAWSLPNAQDALGRAQAQLPPNYGTVQYWSERVQGGVVSGLNNIQVLRVGNLIRNLIFVGRETSSTGKRTDKVLPEFPLINWDARQLNNDSLAYRQNRSYECLEAPNETFENTFTTKPKLKWGRPPGVIAYTFDRSNQDRAGDDKPWLWLPTVEATRLELTGTWETAGVNVILVNDIAPAEVNPTQRYAVPSATGFHPETGTQNPNQP
jgi:hypothetical protein